MNTNISNPLDGITVSHLVEQIAAISNQTEHLTSALKVLLTMDNGDSGECGAPGNIMGQAKAQAIGAVVTSREETNRQVIHFYEKIYDDLMRVHFGERPTPAVVAPDHDLAADLDLDLIEKP